MGAYQETLPTAADANSRPSDKDIPAFREPVGARVLRVGLGLAYLLQPKRIATLPALMSGCTVSLLRGGTRVPTAADVRDAPDSFAGIARDVSAETLIAAHKTGFFPQAHVGPLKWWTRRQRYVLTPADRQIPSRHRAYMRNSDLVVTFDRAFDAVVQACAEPRPGRPRLTWIRPDIMRLYSELHRLGHAHSFELWDTSGKLVGGGYGVSVGRVFVTESLFSRVPNASRMGLQLLNHHLELWGFVLNDVKDCAPHFERLGFRHISRGAYEAILREHAHVSHACPWVVIADLATVARAASPSPSPCKEARPKTLLAESERRRTKCPTKPDRTALPVDRRTGQTGGQ